MFIAISDPVWLAIIATTPPTIMSVLAWWKTRKVEKDVKVIHALVNSPFGIALDALAVAQETVARMTKDPGDIARAAETRRQADEHKARQANLDAANSKS